MSTTPLTSDSLPEPPYTIVGKRRDDRKITIAPPLSILILNRGGRPYRNDYFRDLERQGSFEMISVESQEHSWDVEQLSKRYPKIRFLLLHDQVTSGEAVNIGIKEAGGQLVAVFWNDMIPTAPFSDQQLRRMLELDRLCTVPYLQNPRYETVPSVVAPAFYRNKLKTLPLVPGSDGVASLYPFDYCGIYHRERFISLGGYDREISSPYWQKLDFGFRAYMWGEEIRSSTSLRIRYLSPHEAEETTPDESYGRFYLKNLAVRFDGNEGKLPFGRFFPYLHNRGGSLFDRIREFREAKSWLQSNRFRFTRDARSVTELWETEE